MAAGRDDKRALASLALARLGPQARLTSALGVPVERVTELMIDPSYTTGARCLDTLIQDRRAAVAVARSLSNKDY